MSRTISSQRSHTTRNGTILAVTAVLMTAMMTILALSVDLGYICSMRVQLQRTADASAIAAAWELVAEDIRVTGGDLADAVKQARALAGTYAAMNKVGTKAITLRETDVTIGYRSDVFDAEEPITDFDSRLSNTVRIQIRCPLDQNEAIPLYFARALGFDVSPLQVNATAALLTSFRGFKPPPHNGNVALIPLALDETTWLELLAGGGVDHWSWDHKSQRISSGGDGVREVNLYPGGAGAAGNRGTVVIGHRVDRIAAIRRQIAHGISRDDLAHHGGTLDLNAESTLRLEAEPGIDACLENELTAIKGEPRIIPIFREINHDGTQAFYTIVAWAGIRIMEVRLSDPAVSPRIIAQPAIVKIRGGIPSGPGIRPSFFIFSPVVLVE